MLWKKQKDTRQQRVVQPSPPAKVFSYYQSRSLPAERPALDSKTAARPSLSRKLVHAPAILAVLILAGCLIYLSTLDTNPRLQSVGDPNRAQTILGDLSDYRPEIEKVLEKSLMNRSKLLINTKKLASEIQQTFPELGQVSIVLPLVSRRPIVEVRPADPVMTIASADEAFVVDAEGKALASTNELASAALEGLPHVQDQSGLQLKKGNIVLREETIDFITTVLAQLGQQKLTVQSVLLPSSNPSELHVRLSGEPYIIKLNLRGQGRSQAGTFLAVRSYLKQRGITPAEYIDVRLPEKAFYK